MKYLSILPAALALLLCTTQCKTSKVQEEIYIENALPVEKDTKEADSREPQTLPSFPGGEKARLKFLETNIRYPSEALRQKRQGSVIVGFVVDADGALSDIKIVKSANTFLDAEALRVTKKMPKWIPAKDKDGVGVPIRFTMRILFSGGFD